MNKGRRQVLIQKVACVLKAISLEEICIANTIPCGRSQCVEYQPFLCSSSLSLTLLSLSVNSLVRGTQSLGCSLWDLVDCTLQFVLQAQFSRFLDHTHTRMV